MDQPAADQRATSETVVDSDDEYTKEEVDGVWDEVPLKGEGDDAPTTGHSPGGGRSKSDARADTSTTATEGNARGGPPSEGSGKPHEGEPQAPTSSTTGEPGVPVWTCSNLPPRFFLPPKMSSRCTFGDECTHTYLLEAGVKMIEMSEPPVDIPPLSRKLDLSTDGMLVLTLGSEGCLVQCFEGIFSDPILVAAMASNRTSMYRHTEMDAAAYAQPEPGMLRVIIRDFEFALFTAWDVLLSTPRPILEVDTNVDATKQGPKTAPLGPNNKPLNPHAKEFVPGGTGARGSLVLSEQVHEHFAEKSAPKARRRGPACPPMAKSFSTSY